MQDSILNPMLTNNVITTPYDGMLYYSDRFTASKVENGCIFHIIIADKYLVYHNTTDPQGDYYTLIQLDDLLMDHLIVEFSPFESIFMDELLDHYKACGMTPVIVNDPPVFNTMMEAYVNKRITV